MWISEIISKVGEVKKSFLKAPSLDRFWLTRKACRVYMLLSQIFLHFCIANSTDNLPWKEAGVTANLNFFTPCAWCLDLLRIYIYQGYERGQIWVRWVRSATTAAKAGSEIIVLYNVKSILTDNSI